MLSWIATRLGIFDRLRTAWRQDVRREIDPLSTDVKQLVQSVHALKTSLAQTEERQARAELQTLQLRQVLLWNEKHRDQLAALPALLDPPRIVAHVRAAIDRTPLEVDPFPHIVVDSVLPLEVYKLLLRAIPPTTFFGGQAPKHNLRVPIDAGPALSCRVWQFVDTIVAREAIIPAVLHKFREPIQRHYDTIFGPSFRARAEAMPQAPSGGRVMLRRPGYYLAPHRDPKRSVITCLMYLAKASDNETYGTEIYRVIDDRESSYIQTYYPEEHGCRCELVKVVPYRSNTMLVFVNAQGAHGARIPPDAPADLERYAYQFYVGPGSDALAELIANLPPTRQAMWQDRKPGSQDVEPLSVL